MVRVGSLDEIEDGSNSRMVDKSGVGQVVRNRPSFQGAGEFREESPLGTDQHRHVTEGELLLDVEALDFGGYPLCFLRLLPESPHLDAAGVLRRDDLSCCPGELSSGCQPNGRRENLSRHAE